MKIEGGLSAKAIIRSLKNGFRGLSHMKWVSTSGFHISVVSLLGVAGFVLAIKDGKLSKFGALKWLSEEDDGLEKLCLVPGLQNLGNNCFLNVILQALASCLYFKSFLQNVIEECGLLVAEEQGESLPLISALAALLEDLSAVNEQRVVLSPRKVMLALALYIENFNLASQQDAAEAFLHLLDSLREEFSDSYLPNQGSLADLLTASNCRIITPQWMGNASEQERWLQHFLGPFDGILGSILTCQSCSTQISLDFEFFHTLPLSAMIGRGSTILVGCTLEDCLRQFLGVELIENYQCSHCWHIAAIKYLSTTQVNETEIETLRTCNGQDSCACQSLSYLEKLPWSNNYSRTLKQLRIAHSPKILCLHLQRASMNEFGELVKLQGHIAFPLILNLSPFMTSVVGIKYWEESLLRGQANLLYQKPYASPNHLNLAFDAQMLNCIYGVTSKVLVANDIECTSEEEAMGGEKNLIASEVSHETMCRESNSKESMNCQMSPSGSHLYRLVSVVEHFGKVGSGHYTVYRRVQADSEDHEEHSDSTLSCWFCISDSEAHGVLEKDVLAAEASLLFYERIGDC